MKILLPHFDDLAEVAANVTHAEEDHACITWDIHKLKNLRPRFIDLNEVLVHVRCIGKNNTHQNWNIAVIFHI